MRKLARYFMRCTNRNLRFLQQYVRESDKILHHWDFFIQSTCFDKNTANIGIKKIIIQQ